MKQTAVDWLVKEFNLEEFKATIAVAKAKEWEQIIDAYDEALQYNRHEDGSEYYKEKYEGK